MPSRLVAMLFAALPASALASAPGMDFQEVFRRSVEATQAVPLQETAVERARETLAQARGAFLPQVSGIANITRQHTPEVLGGVAGAFRLRDQRNIRINAQQALFRGMAEFAGYRSAGADVRQQEALARAARLTLFRDVGQAFHAVLAAEADRDDLRRLLEATAQRESEIAERVRIGRSRQAELLQARTQSEGARAQLEAAESRLEQARASFELATGLAAGAALADSVKLPARLAAADEFLALAERRPDVQAAREAREIAEEGVTVARAGHFPALDAQANYYLDRTGVLENVRWDVGLTLTLPIFNGGLVSAATAAAAQAARAAELRLESQRRTARTEILAAHSRVQRALLQLAALERSAEAARRSYESQNREFRLGLVSNLEVTQALNESVQAQRALHATRHEAQAAWVGLHASTGRDSL